MGCTSSREKELEGIRERLQGEVTDLKGKLNFVEDIYVIDADELSMLKRIGMFRDSIESLRGGCESHERRKSNNRESNRMRIVAAMERSGSELHRVVEEIWNAISNDSNVAPNESVRNFRTFSSHTVHAAETLSTRRFASHLTQWI